MAAPSFWRVIILIIGLLTACSSSPDEEPLLMTSALRVGVDPSAPPFASYAGDQLVGFEIDLAREIADRLNVDIAWNVMTFDGIYDSLRAEQADIVIAAISPDPLRTDEVIYSRPYYNAGLVLASPAASPIPEMRDLSEAVLAYAYASDAHAEANRWMRRIAPFQTRAYERPIDALDALRLGFADAALVTAIDAQLYQRSYPDWPCVVYGVTVRPYVIATSIRRSRLAAAVDVTLSNIEQDGTLARIRARWLY